MKALTLHQPWASLIAAGLKTTETRSWAPPDCMLGSRIGIHAAKRKPQIDELNAHVFSVLEDEFPDGEVYMPFGVATRLPRSKIVATARLGWVGQVTRHTTDGTKAHLSTGPVLPYREWDVPIDPYGDYSVGRWIWFLEDIRKLDKPIPAKGMQRFWALPPEIVEQLA